jgi:hypothetical protein
VTDRATSKEGDIMQQEDSCDERILELAKHMVPDLLPETYPEVCEKLKALGDDGPAESVLIMWPVSMKERAVAVMKGCCEYDEYALEALDAVIQTEKDADRCPVSVDDGFFTIHGALGKLEILSDMCHSDATENRAFAEVCMLTVDDAVSDVNRGLQNLVEAFPELGRKRGGLFYTETPDEEPEKEKAPEQ